METCIKKFVPNDHYTSNDLGRHSWACVQEEPAWLMEGDAWWHLCWDSDRNYPQILVIEEDTYLSWLNEQANMQAERLLA